MFCQHCGTKLVEGQRFCSKCGAALTPAPQSNFQPQPQPVPSSGGSSQDTLGLVLKIVAGIGAAVFAVRAVLTLINVFRSLFGIFQIMRYFGFIAGVLSLLNGPVLNVLFTAANAALCVVLLCFVLRKNDEHNEHLFLALCGAGVLRIAVTIVRTVLSLLISLVQGYGFGIIGSLILGIVWAILWAAVPAGIVFLLLHLMGKTPLKGKTGNDISAMARDVIPAVTSVLRGQKA